MRNYKQEPWSYKEKQILTNHYYMGSGADELLKLLPGRTAGSCRTQVSRLRREGWHFKRPQKQFF